MFGSVASLLIFTTIQSPSAQEPGVDAIYTGGPILTIDEAAPRPEAVAVANGKIVAVGKAADVMKLKGSKTKLIDLAGRAMLPGFIDSHGHMMVGGLQALSANMLPPPDGPNADIATIQRTLRDWRAANEDVVAKTKLIIGFGYDNAQLKERRAPTREELDAVANDIPVVIIHQSGHLAVFNSQALELVGYSAETPDPKGGVIQRKPGSKEPNGVLEETAWLEVVPKILGSVGPTGLRVMAEEGAKLWASFGYTTAQEARAIPATSEVMKAVAKDGKYKIDVAVYPDILVDRDYIKSNVSSSYVNRFRIAGAKLTIDGSPQGFTAWRDRPYYNPVGNYPPGYVGYAAATPEQVFGAINWAYENNIQIVTHVNGEAASDQLIAAHTEAQKTFPKADRRHVLIHGQFQREDQVESFVRLGVIPSLFPMHTYYWGDWHRDHTVGPALADNISPTAWYQKRRAIFTSHHDAPVAFPDSIRVLSSTVTRRSRSGDIIGPAQRVSVETALKSLTLWAAHQISEDDSKGSIEVGKLADFTILSGDPTAVDPEQLSTLKVIETIKEGRQVYVAGTKRTDILRGKEFPSQTFFELFRQMHIRKSFARLPAAHRTPMAFVSISRSFDDCGAGFLLPELFGLEPVGRPAMAAKQ
jgi:predicted amidohydrolase YtcJ